jgi:hypothetical protein
MPAARASLIFNRTFPEEEYQLLGLGLIPEVMEDKWFIYLDGDWLVVHRGWTGYCWLLYPPGPASYEDGRYQVAGIR